MFKYLGENEMAREYISALYEVELTQWRTILAITAIGSPDVKLTSGETGTEALTRLAENKQRLELAFNHLIEEPNDDSTT